MTNETQVEETTSEPVREYGFTVMVEKDGNIKLTPHNLVNDFEFVGLAEYVNQKKSDVVKTIGVSIETRTLHSIGLLAKALAGAAQNDLKVQ